MAEQNAKNKIIESITPQIRRLIEQQLDIEPDDAGIPGDEAEDEMGSDLDSLLAEPVQDLPPADGAHDVGLAPEPVSLDLDSLGMGAPDSAPAPDMLFDEPSMSDSGNVPDEDQEVNIDINFNSDEDEDGDDEILLSQESANALARLIRQSPKAHVVTEAERHASRLNTRVKRFSTLVEGLDTRRLTKAQRVSARNHYSKLLGEAIKLRDSVIFRNVTMSEMLKFQILNILQEMKNMSNRRNRALFNNLFESGTDEAAKMDELDATLVLTPDDEDEEVEVEDLLGDLAVEFELETPSGEEDLGDDEGEEVDDEELGGEEELDLGMEEHAFEIDEAMLRRELRKMRRINENDPVDGSGDSSFGGGTAEDEMFVDVDEETLLNALADELGDAPMPQAGAALPESRRRRLARRNSRLREARAARRRMAARGRKVRSTRQGARRTTVNEGRQNRALKGKLNEYRSAVGQLRTQLNEMNLFNAKLLFANKLMQNRDLTDKQQRAIVEALDNAKTLNEAKLLYKSLTASLNKRRTRNGRSLTEGSRRVLASASRSTRSAAPAGNGVEVDRWALLAGINGKDNN
jgi:hypothetical protein